MWMKLEYSKELLKYINKLDRKSKQRLKAVFDRLSMNPPQGDIKPVKGEENLYRLRTGDLRILFNINADSNTILVSKIAPRSQVYKKKGG
jgi:mRNA interferase RelE/StbE